jgi:hypothetical protein
MHEIPFRRGVEPLRIDLGRWQRRIRVKPGRTWVFDAQGKDVSAGALRVLSRVEGVGSVIFRNCRWNKTMQAQRLRTIAEPGAPIDFPISFEACRWLDGLDLSEARFGNGGVRFVGCAFQGKANFDGVEVEGGLEILESDWSCCTQCGGQLVESSSLRAAAAQVGGDFIVSMRSRSRIHCVHLQRAKITGRLRLDGGVDARDVGAAPSGARLPTIALLCAEGVSVEQSIELEGLRVAHIDLGRARVAGQIECVGVLRTPHDVPCKGGPLRGFGLTLQGATINSHVLLKCSRFDRVKARRAKIGGHLYMRHACLGAASDEIGAGVARLDLNTAEIGGNLHLHRVSFWGRLNLRARIDGSVYFEGVCGKLSHLASVPGSSADLIAMDDARIGSALLFDEAPACKIGDVSIPRRWNGFGGSLNLGVEVFGDVRMRSTSVYVFPRVGVLSNSSGRSYLCGKSVGRPQDPRLSGSGTDRYSVRFEGARVGGSVYLGVHGDRGVAEQVFDGLDDPGVVSWLRTFEAASEDRRPLEDDVLGWGIQESCGHDVAPEHVNHCTMEHPASSSVPQRWNCVMLGGIDLRAKVGGTVEFRRIHVDLCWNPFFSPGNIAKPRYFCALDLRDGSIARGIRFHEYNWFGGACLAFAVRSSTILAGEVGKEMKGDVQPPVPEECESHERYGPNWTRSVIFEGACIFASATFDSTSHVRRATFRWRPRPQPQSTTTGQPDSSTGAKSERYKRVSADLVDAALSLQGARIDGGLILRDCEVGRPDWVGPQPQREYRGADGDSSATSETRASGRRDGPPPAFVSALARIEGNLDVRGSHFYGTFDAEDCCIRGELNMSRADVHGALVLRAATVEGTVFADEASSDGGVYPKMNWWPESEPRPAGQGNPRPGRDLSPGRSGVARLWDLVGGATELEAYRDTPVHPWRSRARLSAGDVDLRYAKIAQIDLKFPDQRRGDESTKGPRQPEIQPRRILLDYVETNNITLRGKFDTDRVPRETEFSWEGITFKNIEVRDDFDAQGRQSDPLGQQREWRWVRVGAGLSLLLVAFAMAVMFIRFQSKDDGTRLWSWSYFGLFAAALLSYPIARHGRWRAVFPMFAIGVLMCGLLWVGVVQPTVSNAGDTRQQSADASGQLLPAIGVALVSCLLLIAVIGACGEVFGRLARPMPKHPGRFFLQIFGDDEPLEALAIFVRWSCWVLIASAAAYFVLGQSGWNGVSWSALLELSGVPGWLLLLYITLASFATIFRPQRGSSHADKEVLDLMQRSRFSRSTYIAIEKWMRSSGNSPMANEVYLARLRRECEDYARRAAWSEDSFVTDGSGDGGPNRGRVAFFRARVFALYYAFIQIASPKLWGARLLDLVVGHGVHVSRPLHVFVLLWFINWGVFADPYSVERPLTFQAFTQDQMASGAKPPAWASRAPNPTAPASSTVTPTVQGAGAAAATDASPQPADVVDNESAALNGAASAATAADGPGGGTAAVGAADGARVPNGSSYIQQGGSNPWIADGGAAIGGVDAWNAAGAFFVSMRLQIPLINLISESDWEPSSRNMPIKIFGTLQLTYENFAATMMVINSVLLSLVIASVTGYLKRSE